MGFISNKRENFEPYRKINKVEALKIIFVSLGFPISNVPPEFTQYSDISILEWYSPYIGFAEINNI